MREGELEARPGGLSSAEGLSWGSGTEPESAWEGERDSTQKQQPAGGRERRGGGEQKLGPGTEAERPHDWESPMRQMERAGDAGTRRARPRGRKWGEEAAKGLEQMRAAGARNRAQDTENGNGGGGCEGKEGPGWGASWGEPVSAHARAGMHAHTRMHAGTPWL